MSVRLELNDEIRDALRIPPEEQEGRLRRELALRLYEKGLLSFEGRGVDTGDPTCLI
jgi:hypothetical protein